MKHVKLERIVLKGHPELTERWVQDQIAQEPSLLGLGDLELRDKERIHPQAGRLDLLLHDRGGARRYEVEVQLGRTDESHIIRTLEYWDIERKRYPQYDHVAVIVAEEITSRFLNVVSLFNGAIPLIAIQMHAYKVEDGASLLFTTVLSERQLGTDEEDEPIEPSDRASWEGRVGKATMEITDSIADLVKAIDPTWALKYNKSYIGFARNGQPTTIALLLPKKEWVRVLVRLERSEEMLKRLEEAGVDLLDYDARGQRYNFRLASGDVQKHASLLTEIFKAALDSFAG